MNVMSLAILQMLFWLVSVHFLCDYPLQGDFLAKAKNHKSPINGVPWYQALLAHAFIQGAGVALITSSVSLGLLEAIAHVVIDYGKSDGWYSFNMDQFLHLLCKFIWLLCLELQRVLNLFHGYVI